MAKSMRRGWSRSVDETVTCPPPCVILLIAHRYEQAAQLSKKLASGPLLSQSCQSIMAPLGCDKSPRPSNLHKPKCKSFHRGIRGYRRRLSWSTIRWT